MANNVVAIIGENANGSPYVQSQRFLALLPLGAGIVGDGWHHLPPRGAWMQGIMVASALDAA